MDDYVSRISADETAYQAMADNSYRSRDLQGIDHPTSNGQTTASLNNCGLSFPTWSNHLAQRCPQNNTNYNDPTLCGPTLSSPKPQFRRMRFLQIQDALGSDRLDKHTCSLPPGLKDLKGGMSLDDLSARLNKLANDVVSTFAINPRLRHYSISISASSSSTSFTD